MLGTGGGAAICLQGAGYKPQAKCCPSGAWRDNPSPPGDELDCHRAHRLEGGLALARVWCQPLPSAC